MKGSGAKSSIVWILSSALTQCFFLSATGGRPANVPVSPLIIGGVAAPNGAYPWIVAPVRSEQSDNNRG